MLWNTSSWTVWCPWMKHSSTGILETQQQFWRLCSCWVAPDQIDYSWHAQFIWLHCPPTLLLLLVSEMCIFCVFAHAVCVKSKCVFFQSQFYPCSKAVEQVMILLSGLFISVQICTRYYKWFFLHTVVLYIHFHSVYCLCACVYVIVCMHVCLMTTPLGVPVCECVYLCVSPVFVHMQGSNVMEDQDLRDIGITDPGHRKKILHAARNLPKVLNIVIFSTKETSNWQDLK